LGKANPLMRIFGDYCEDIASLRRLTKKKRRDAKLLTTLLTPRAFGCTTRDLFGSAILVEPSSDIAAHKKRQNPNTQILPKIQKLTATNRKHFPYQNALSAYSKRQPDTCWFQISRRFR
jgi:hypothetical protein